MDEEAVYDEDGFNQWGMTRSEQAREESDAATWGSPEYLADYDRWATEKAEADSLLPEMSQAERDEIPW